MEKQGEGKRCLKDSKHLTITSEQKHPLDGLSGPQMIMRNFPYQKAKKNMRNFCSEADGDPFESHRITSEHSLPPKADLTPLPSASSHISAA